MVFQMWEFYSETFSEGMDDKALADRELKRNCCNCLFHDRIVPEGKEYFLFSGASRSASGTS